MLARASVFNPGTHSTRDNPPHCPPTSSRPPSSSWPPYFHLAPLLPPVPPTSSCPRTSSSPLLPPAPCPPAPPGQGRSRLHEVVILRIHLGENRSGRKLARVMLASGKHGLVTLGSRDAFLVRDRVTSNKLDWVGPVDNKPSID